MNSQWMTTLLLKGIELEQNLRKNFKQAQEDIKKKLEDRGLKLSPTDLAALIEELSPESSRTALSYALDLMRPFSAGMGFRVSKLTDTHIEMVIPTRTRNQNENSELHEGALLTAGIEAAKLLWMRHAPLGTFQLRVKKVNMEVLQKINQECRVRMELTETQREKILSELRQKTELNLENTLVFFDDNEQVLAELTLEMQAEYTPSLQAPED